jgi:hypothetical protein
MTVYFQLKNIFYERLPLRGETREKTARVGGFKPLTTFRPAQLGKTKFGSVSGNSL